MGSAPSWKACRCDQRHLLDAKNLAACDIAHQRNTETVSQGHTDLRWGQPLLGKLADVINDIFWLHLDPGWRLAAVRDSRRGNTLALAIHAAHLVYPACPRSRSSCLQQP